MSPASRSAAKELQKASFKPSSPGTTGSGIMASAYNPLSGTFYTIEASPTASSPPAHGNGRFRNMDETDEHSSSSIGTGAEYDSVSNNDSCSGESEDQKEKTTNTTVGHEVIPGSDNDKREKIRQKNERKHQRQRERRAKELHERCSGHLMSRKLEALCQQLVVMGFSSERATMALTLNEGRIEESVSWLFEGDEEAVQHKCSDLHSGGSLKIDITEELGQIVDMEIKYKCSKQEVERAVVASEGDLEKAAETLRAQKQEPPASLPKPEEIGDQPAVNGVKLAVSVGQNLMRSQAKSNSSVTIQQRRDERDFIYTKAPPTMLASPESANGNLQSLRRIQQKSEWAKPQAAASVENRWSCVVSSPFVSYSLAPPLKAESRYVMVGSEVKNLQPGVPSEPVIMMQHPQSNTKQSTPVTSISASPPVTTGLYQPQSVTGAEIMKSNAGFQQVPNTTNLSLNSVSSQQFYHQPHYQPFVSNPVDSPSAGWGASWNPTWTSASQLAVPPASLGSFSGWGLMGSSDSSSPVDRNTGGSMPQCDYTNVDWTLESTLPSEPSGLWLGLASFVKNGQTYDSWPSTTLAGAKSSMRSANLNGVCTAGLPERVAAETSSAETSEGPCEWISPFAGKDLFSIPRQFVTSPSL